MAKKMVVVDTGRCTLCKGCLEVAPEVFRYNQDLNIIQVADLEHYPEPKVDEAIKLCPEDCITWEDE